VPHRRRPHGSRRLITEFARLAGPGQPLGRTLDAVTEREREVLRLIARGLSNAEIAEHLHLTVATVKTHVGHLLTKTGGATVHSSSSWRTRPASSPHRGGKPRDSARRW